MKLTFTFLLLACFFVVSCEESSDSIRVNKPGPRDPSAQGKISVPSSSNLRLAVFSLDDFGRQENSNRGKNLKSYLNQAFEQQLDLVVFTGVVSPSRLVSEVVHKEYTCETFSERKEVRGFQYIVVCRNPQIYSISENNGLPEELKSHRISRVARSGFERSPPGFQGVYEFKDGFRFFLVALDLIPGVNQSQQRQKQLAALRKYLNTRIPKELPLLIIGNWQNIPAALVNDDGLSEMESFLLELEAVHSDFDFVQSSRPRTVVFNDEYKPRDEAKKYNNLVFTTKAWNVAEGSGFSKDGCRREATQEEKENHVDRLSRHCLVRFELKRSQ